MICDCGNQNAYQKRIYTDREGIQEICDQCGTLSVGDAATPDVYLAHSGQKFKNLCDDMGRPYEIRSKRHKKEIMDKMGVQEAGDLVNGAKYGSKSWVEGSRDYRRRQFDKERPMIRENYKRYLDNARNKR